MRSIFWKIFLSFWLAMVLITIVAVITSFKVARNYSELIDELDRREVVRAASVALEESGLEGFKSWLKRDALLPPEMTMYLLDSQGNDALDRPVPQRIKRQWRRFKERMESRDRRRGEGRRGGSGGLSHEFTAPSGDSYRPMLGTTPPRVFGVLEVPRLALQILLLGILISSAVCYGLSRYLARPISRIAGAAQSLASGQLDSRVGSSAYRADEIGTLARQFDEMAAGLERSEASRRGLFRNISHELRSPLARINVALELANRTPERLPHHLDRIGREAEHMERLVAQVLELVRAQEHQIGDAQLMNLEEIMLPVTEDAGFEGKPFNKTVEFLCADESLMVYGYPELLSSAIENVLRNAVAHTPQDSTVSASLSRQNGQAVIRICDQGSGVPDAELERLFEPFYRQADNTLKGAGVGLAITAQGIELMRGTVVARNDEGGGLCVEMCLPLAAG